MPDCRISFSAVGGRNTLRMERSPSSASQPAAELARAMADDRHGVIPGREQSVDRPPIQAQSAGVHISVAGLRQEVVAHLDIRQMAKHDAMGVQRALRIARVPEV